MSKPKERQEQQRTYYWRPGSQHKIYAETAALEMQRLLDDHNQRLDAADVLDSAEAPTSPLHSEFEWDDTAAAKQHRLLQARNLMNGIKVSITVMRDKKPQNVEYSFMAAVQKPDGGGRRFNYTSTEYAMREPDLRAELLQNALLELAAFRRKYADLSELSMVFVAIDKVRKAG